MSGQGILVSDAQEVLINPGNSRLDINPNISKPKHDDGYHQGTIAAIVSTIGNLVLTGFKFTAGILGNSSAMIADAVHSASDVITSIAVWIGMKVAAKPADQDHPWGHGKAEAVAAKTVAIILILVGIEIGIEALKNISENTTNQVKPIALWAAAISIVLKEANFQYVWRIGKKYDSVSLKADAWHHRSDAISSVAALIGIAFTIFGGARWHFMDHLAAFVVAAMIVFVGIKFFKSATADLMDENIPPDRISDIKKILLETPGALDIEAISARKSGLGIHVDVHLEVDPSITVKQGHDIASDAKKKLKEKYPAIQNVLVHIEPYYPDDH